MGNPDTPNPNHPSAWSNQTSRCSRWSYMEASVKAVVNTRNRGSRQDIVPQPRSMFIRQPIGVIFFCTNVKKSIKKQSNDLFSFNHVPTVQEETLSIHFSSLSGTRTTVQHPPSSSVVCPSVRSFVCLTPFSCGFLVVVFAFILHDFSCFRISRRQSVCLRLS